MKIEIDKRSGFCFGVVGAIEKAEEALLNKESLYCLGDIVHNNAEIFRLEKLGMKTINHNEFKELKGGKVLIRAHGEPPETYQIAQQNQIELIEATCPVVLKLQERIKKAYLKSNEDNGQVVIFGKKGHAEVIGLNGQTGFNSIVVESLEDLKEIDFTRPVRLYAQTTKQKEVYLNIKEQIISNLQENGLNPEKNFEFNNTICKQVSGKTEHFKEFSKNHDIILFVSGKKSSNGKVSFETCKSVNENSFLISSEDEIDLNWFQGKEFVGICGATSTPHWLMKNIAKMLKTKFNAEILNG